MSCANSILDTDIDLLKSESDILKESIKSAIMKFKENTCITPSIDITIQSVSLGACRPEVVKITVDIKAPV